MSSDPEGPPDRHATEKALYRYSTALEHGDFDTLGEVLHAAEQDPALERMILELHAEYRVDEDAAAVIESSAAPDPPDTSEQP